VPAWIGVDIGCGVISYPIGDDPLDFRKFDNQIKRSIPSGMTIHSKFDDDRCERAYGVITKSSMHHFVKALNDTVERLKLPFRNEGYVNNSIGTLGGGNHFIAINQNKDGENFITIHSGSRNFGLKIANRYQKLVGETGYLEGNLFDDYFQDMGLAQQYAEFNRVKMMWELLKYLNIPFEPDKLITSVHNYIDIENRIIRKGAISAQKGELCIIPINMADGVLLCEGKGNPEWNYSAPHGAGRILSRNGAKKTLTMEEYKERMKNVWSSCVTEATLDESPMAYKSVDYIKDSVQDTVEVLDHLKEIYNFKAIEA